MSEKHKYLVTGTAGFIGMHVAEGLLQLGHEATGVDNFNDYYSVPLKRARHARLNAYRNFHEGEVDIAEYHALERVFTSFQPDRVCHLAAQAGVRYSLVNPFAYERSNLAGFLNVLELCRRNHVERLVYASSSSVYGGNTKLPFSETDPVETPISLYAATKRSNELMAHSYTHLFGLPTVGLRFFTVYGPWGRPDMAMWLFTRAILEGLPIEVFNFGDMQRDFTYIDDITAGVLASLEAEKLPRYLVMNIGHHHPEQLLEVIAIIEQALGKTAEKAFLPMQDGDIKASCADIELARKYLNFEPRTAITDGIPRFIEWFLAHRDLT